MIQNIDNYVLGAAAAFLADMAVRGMLGKKNGISKEFLKLSQMTSAIHETVKGLKESFTIFETHNREDHKTLFGKTDVLEKEVSFISGKSFKRNNDIMK